MLIRVYGNKVLYWDLISLSVWWQTLPFCACFSAKFPNVYLAGFYFNYVAKDKNELYAYTEKYKILGWLIIGTCFLITIPQHKCSVQVLKKM